MFIKYNENEPVIITHKDAGEFIYAYKELQHFKLIFTLEVYQKTCSLSITYNDYIIFAGAFINVTRIKKADKHSIVIFVENEEKVRVKFSIQVGLELL